MCTPLLILLLALLRGCGALSWENNAPKDGETLRVCLNSTLELGWKVAKTKEEKFVNIVWFREGAKEELLATSFNGHFLGSGRVKPHNNAGIVLRNVTLGDTGNYSVVVTGEGETCGVVSLERTVVVEIIDDLMTTDGRLHAQQLSEATWSNVTDQWHVTLGCGVFPYPGYPPFDVEWIKPSGKIEQSSRYEKGRFLLLLGAAETEGTYTCRIHSDGYSAACIRQAVNSSVTVDGVRARQTLLLKQQDTQIKQLKAENDNLKEELVTLNDSYHQERDSDTQIKQLQAENGNLKEEVVSLNDSYQQEINRTLASNTRISQLEAENDDLTDKVEACREGGQTAADVQCTNKGYQMVEGRCLKVYEVRKTWWDAKTTCQEHGGHLYFLNSKDDAKFLQNSVIDKLVSPQDSYWVGASRGDNGDFRWTDERPLSKDDRLWGSGEPNNKYGKENCVEVVTIHFYLYIILSRHGLNDLPCSYRRHFICELDIPVSNSN